MGSRVQRKGSSVSKKHNTKHDSRGTSNYPLRLRDRGESSASVRMPFIDQWGRKHDTAEALRRREMDPPRKGEEAA